MKSADDPEYQEIIKQIRAMDKGHFAIEISLAAEEALQALFNERNVPDILREAHGLASPNVAQSKSLPQHYKEMLEHGIDSPKYTGFVSNLKGKIAELKTKSILEEQKPGWNFELAESPNQPCWDLTGTSPSGEVIYHQVKTGKKRYANETVDAMQDNPNIEFLISTEIYESIENSHPELVNRITDIGSDAELTENAKDGLKKLTENMGIDVPDSIGRILPHAAEIVAGIKLLWQIVSTERELAGVDLKDRSRVHSIKALALMTKFGIIKVCMSAGAAGGAAGGSIVPGPGNIIGGLVGGGSGALFGRKLNQKLQPRFEEVTRNLATKLVGGDPDDLFYWMNKVQIDKIGTSMAATQVA